MSKRCNHAAAAHRVWVPTDSQYQPWAFRYIDQEWLSLLD